MLICNVSRPAALCCSASPAYCSKLACHAGTGWQSSLRLTTRSSSSIGWGWTCSKYKGMQPFMQSRAVLCVCTICRHCVITCSCFYCLSTYCLCYSTSLYPSKSNEDMHQLNEPPLASTCFCHPWFTRIVRNGEDIPVAPAANLKMQCSQNSAITRSKGGASLINPKTPLLIKESTRIK